MPLRSNIRAALRRARQTYREYSDVTVAKTPSPPARSDDPDVYLDVPTLHVDEIDLRLDELKARVALEAQVLDLLRLNVGVDAELRGVELDIKGVDAQALLKVRLDNLAVIVDRVMSTVDRNPQVLEGLTERLAAAVGDLGNGAGAALGSLGR
jgi:hypothetical protein